MTLIMEKFNALQKDMLNALKYNGVVLQDNNLNRKVETLFGSIVDIDGILLRGLKRSKITKKYEEDWYRMADSFRNCAMKAIEDRTSRQLMIFNDEDFYLKYQCFTHFQFVGDGVTFLMIVYQRSGDIKKQYDDFKFFGNIAKRFEKFTGTHVKQIKVIYGNLHTETK